MIIKTENNKNPNYEIPTMKKNKNDIIKELLQKYKYLIDKEIAKDKKYTNRLKVLNKNIVGNLTDTLIFCPEELLNSFLLCIILKYMLIHNLKIYRSSDISDIAFNKNDTIKGIQYIRDKVVIVILDMNTNEYVQTLLIQLYENRVKKGFITIFAFNFDMVGIEKYPILDKYLFPDGQLSRYNFTIYDVFEIKSEYTKRWTLNAKSNKNNTNKK